MRGRHPRGCLPSLGIGQSHPLGLMLGPIQSNPDSRALDYRISHPCKTCCFPRSNTRSSEAGCGAATSTTLGGLFTVSPRCVVIRLHFKKGWPRYQLQLLRTHASQAAARTYRDNWLFSISGHVSEGGRVRCAIGHREWQPGLRRSSGDLAPPQLCWPHSFYYWGLDDSLPGRYSLARDAALLTLAVGIKLLRVRSR